MQWYEKDKKMDNKWVRIYGIRNWELKMNAYKLFFETITVNFVVAKKKKYLYFNLIPGWAAEG